MFTENLEERVETSDRSLQGLNIGPGLRNIPECSCILTRSIFVYFYMMYLCCPFSLFSFAFLCSGTLPSLSISLSQFSSFQILVTVTLLPHVKFLVLNTASLYTLVRDLSWITVNVELF